MLTVHYKTFPMPMGLGRLASTVTEKTEALALCQGPGAFWADWIVTVWLSLQSGALSLFPPQLWVGSLCRGSGVAFTRNIPKELTWARV